mgnify:CR=1 FL=1
MNDEIINEINIFVKTIKHQIIIQITTHEIILTVINRQTILRKDMQK